MPPKKNTLHRIRRKRISTATALDAPVKVEYTKGVDRLTAEVDLGGIAIILAEATFYESDGWTVVWGPTEMNNKHRQMQLAGFELRLEETEGEASSTQDGRLLFVEATLSNPGTATDCHIEVRICEWKDGAKTPIHTEVAYTGTLAAGKSVTCTSTLKLIQKP